MTRADAASALLAALGNGSFQATVHFQEEGGTLTASAQETGKGRVTVTRTASIRFAGRPKGRVRTLTPKGRRAISKAVKAMWARRKAAAAGAA